MKPTLRQVQARLERLQRLREVSHVIHSTLEPEAALRLIVTEAVRLVGASSGSVVLVNPMNGFLEIQASCGLPEQAAALRLRVGEGITGWVARSGQTARVGDVSADPRYIPVRPGIRSELAVPLRLQDEVRGVLNVDSERANAFGADDEGLLGELAREAARVIENTWRYEQLRLKAGLFESLVSVSRVINSALNLQETLGVIAREACLLMGARVCSALLLDDSREWLELRACHGAGPAYLAKPRLSADDSLVGIAVRRKKPVQVENVQTSNLYQNGEVARQEGLFGLLSVPLLYGGQCIGALNVYMAKPHLFSNEEIGILSALAELSAIAIHRAELYERLADVEEQLRHNEKLSALGLLAAEVAHEIRNPLTVIKMLYHSLDLKFPAGDPRATDAGLIHRKIEQLNRIVERILEFARTAEPHLGSVDLNRVIQELGLLVRHKLKNQQVTWVPQLDPELPQVSGDAAQLEQAFLNLVLNAAEAMSEGGTLTVATRPVETKAGAPGRVLLEFRDTGPGMTADQQRKAFRSLLGTTKAKGTGLGLAIVARIIEAHHGDIKIKAREGRGTTVTVTLPIGP